MKTDNPYQEAMRYIENAREQLKLAGKDGKFYIDEKYVKSASGIAYLGVLKALDFLFDIKNIDKQRGRKSIEYYQRNLARIDSKLLKNLNEAYHLLHLDGYYGGIVGIKTIDTGFDYAITVINALKPYSKSGDSVN